MSYRNTCPQRTVTKVHHTLATWLPVTLSCGHTEQINWTARVGSVIGCTRCAEAIAEPTCDPVEAARVARNGVSPEIRASQIAYAMRPFAVRWIDSHCSITNRFHSLTEAYEYMQDQWARIQRDVAANRYRASNLWQSRLETPTGNVQLAYVLLTADVSSYYETVATPADGTAFPSKVRGARSMRYEIRRSADNGSSSYRLPSDQPTRNGNETSHPTREAAQLACDNLNAPSIKTNVQQRAITSTERAAVALITPAGFVQVDGKWTDVGEDEAYPNG